MESSMSRSALDSIAYALCANEESDCPDYGIDYQAELIHAQLVADGHVAAPSVDQAHAWCSACGVSRTGMTGVEAAAFLAEHAGCQ